RLDIAVFAHNEEGQISALISDLSQQDILADENYDLRILILANGCSDNTVATTRQAVDRSHPALAQRVSIFDLEKGGKSRTGHQFIHELSRQDAGFLGFMDADIRLPNHDTLRRMMETLNGRHELQVFTSRPVKDVHYNRLKTGIIGRLIAAGGGGLTDWRKSICGQLFIVQAGAIRRVGLPAGLPVEDGFFRAMLLTNLLSQPEDLSLIDGDPEIFHIYESITSLGELIQHQTRIVMGSAVNAALFQKIRRDAPTEPQAHELLMAAAQNDAWLGNTIRAELPHKPYGYVPHKFMTNRWHRYRTGAKRGIKNTLIMLLGSAFDALIWLNATRKMRKGAGAGHW
ncbi:MAG: glycosyltransferase, partial [Paracoccus sp. (in: a-proteobacteria)]